MTYLTSYIDGLNNIETLNGFTDNAENYITRIYNKYSLLTGFTGDYSDNEGYFWGDIHISSNFSKDDSSFDSILEIQYRLDDDSSEFFTDLYSLTFDLNNDNKFNITENLSYEDFDYSINYYDGTYAYSNFYDESNDITSLNVITGEQKNERLWSRNFEFYLGDNKGNSLDYFKKSNHYGLSAVFDYDGKAVVVQNLETENHSKLFEFEYLNENAYFDSISENILGTFNMVYGSSDWTYKNNYRNQSAVENYKLITYKKDGSLATVDLGTYKNIHNFGVNWQPKLRATTDFFLWNDDDSDTWLVKEKEYIRNNYGYSYYEGYVLDDDFNINNEADLTLKLDRNENLDSSPHISGNDRGTGGFSFGFIFSETEAEYNYEQSNGEKIANVIKEANEWDNINYDSFDWSEVDYKSLSNYATDVINWSKVDLEIVVESDNFKFDAVDWKEVDKKGGINKGKAYKLINDYQFDQDSDSINLENLKKVKKIKAGGGNDYVKGNSSNNIFYGQEGKDTLKGDNGSDKLYGGSSADKLYGDKGDDYLYGGSDADTLYGGYGKDRLLGQIGNDCLKGGTGNDFLTGGLGKDCLIGGAGKDKFCINTGSGRDEIKDYTSSEDKIKLLGGISRGDLTIRQAGADVKIKYEGDLMAIVKDTLIADLTFI